MACHPYPKELTAMRKILMFALVCLLLPALASAQSGRRNLANYQPENEVKAIFQQELAYMQRMVGYVYTTRTTYMTPTDGRSYERVSEVGRHDDGSAFERRKISRRSNQKLLKKYYYLFTGQVLDPGTESLYRFTRLREEDGLVVWDLSPLAVPEQGRLFRGQVWVNDKHEIVRAGGEYVPRWRAGVYAMACTLQRENSLPARLACDDSIVVNGQVVGVQMRADFYDFKRFGVTSSAELEDIAEEQ
jgi:hypothetical protein